MKEALKKISNVCKTIFGWGILVALLGGGLTFFGYVIALIVGGETAVQICAFMKTYITPNAILLSTIMILFGIFAMYLAGELALTPTKREKNGNPVKEKTADKK